MQQTMVTVTFDQKVEEYKHPCNKICTNALVHEWKSKCFQWRNVFSNRMQQTQLHPALEGASSILFNEYRRLQLILQYITKSLNSQRYFLYDRDVNGEVIGRSEGNVHRKCRTCQIWAFKTSHLSMSQERVICSRAPPPTLAWLNQQPARLKPAVLGPV